jgi:spore coat protein U-like protein
MLKKILCLIISTGFMSLNAQAQSNSNSATTTTKATATLSSNCIISAQNVSFSMINLPISSQTSTSSMSVLCSKNASYTIGLAYGGVYGTGTNEGYWSVTGAPKYTLAYYDASGARKVNVEANSISSYATYMRTNYPTIPLVTTVAGFSWGNIGTFNVGSAYGYGKMIGISSGDSIAYSIQVPNNPGQIWNSGNYNYTDTGSGSTQSIPIVATLVPSQTTSAYPSADMYMDTVVATINY